MPYEHFGDLALQAGKTNPANGFQTYNEGEKNMPVSIVINGIAVPGANCSTSGNTTTCLIAGTYGNVEVTSHPSGTTAKVVAVYDATLPVLQLLNAKFRATANAVNGSVTFEATSMAGRNGPKMQRVAGGWLGRIEGTSAPYTSPTNRGQFIVDGVVISSSTTPNAESIDGISSGGDTSGSSKVVLSTAWAAGEIKDTTFTKTETMGSLNGSRTLKGEFTFYLPLTNDYLRLTKVNVETKDPFRREDDPALLGYTDLWDDDTGRCKHKPAKTGKKGKSQRKSIRVRTAPKLGKKR